MRQPRAARTFYGFGASYRVRHEKTTELDMQRARPVDDMLSLSALCSCDGGEQLECSMVLDVVRACHKITTELSGSERPFEDLPPPSMFMRRRRTGRMVHTTLVLLPLVLHILGQMRLIIIFDHPHSS